MVASDGIHFYRAGVGMLRTGVNRRREGISDEREISRGHVQTWPRNISRSFYARLSLSDRRRRGTARSPEALRKVRWMIQKCPREMSRAPPGQTPVPEDPWNPDANPAAAAEARLRWRRARGCNYFNRARVDLMRTGGFRQRGGIKDDREITRGHVQHDREISRGHSLHAYFYRDNGGGARLSRQRLSARCGG